MPHTSDHPAPHQRDDAADAAYRGVLRTLDDAGVPFLVGGAYALARHTGVERATKDLDLFLRPGSIDAAMAALDSAGYETERTHPHWLGKAHAGEVFVDLIYNSGNGVTPVDDEWFYHAPEAQVLGRPVRLVPAVELLWSKLYIMERERYDGGDVAHLLRDRADDLDWPRLMRRVGHHWRVLFSHLVLFGFVYPGERHRIPGSVIGPLLQRLQHELQAPPPGGRLCFGTLLSREQYLADIEREGWLDARLTGHSSMQAGDITAWTQAIPDRHGDEAAAPAGPADDRADDARSATQRPRTTSRAPASRT